MEMHARLKLEVPVPFSNLKRVVPADHIDAQIKLLKECFEKFDIVFDDGVQTEVDEPGCEKFVEVHYEIACMKFSTSLILSLRTFLFSLISNQFPHHMKGIVIVNSPECFSNQLISAHLEKPVKALYFGNIQGGVLISHWEVSYRNNHKSDDITVDFEYDNNDIIAIRFKNKEEGNDITNQNGIIRKSKVKGTAHYLLVIKRNNIRRIIVDLSVSDSFGSNRTRIHLDLNCPVMIRKGFTSDKQLKDSHNEYGTMRRNRYLVIYRGKNDNEYPDKLAIADSPVFTIEFGESVSDSEIYLILSRLRARCGISIEFASISIVEKLFWKENPYHRWTNKISDGLMQRSPSDSNDPTFRKFLDTTFPLSNTDDKKEKDLLIAKRFAIVYLIECLISRGAIVKDQILLDINSWTNFLGLISACYKRNSGACEASLERLIQMIDERKRIGSIVIAFYNECKHQLHAELNFGLSQDEIREGYQRVRKIIFTPTRVIYVVPETLMSNRVLRAYDHNGTRVLRVAFRDDDNDHMRSSKTSDTLIQRTVGGYLQNGIRVAGRDFGYLGSSNSQMRDAGAYFMEKYSASDLRAFQRQNNVENPPETWCPKITKVRQNLGRFERMKSIPKMMARLGQCFTQSRQSGVELTRPEYKTTYDIVGGENLKMDEYTFSDGVGMISKQFARKIAEDMNLGKGTPCCFQFRFRGMKGVVAVEPTLDEIRIWAENNKIPRPSGMHGNWAVQCMFRPSQNKFEAKRKDIEYLEVVKFSSPVPVALNKPFINILDQASGLQSFACHQRICNRIEELLDKQMRGFAKTMIIEQDCRNRLKELPRRIDVDLLSVRAGFQLSAEPFFRSLIKASVKFSITKQLRKEQIQIPFEKGRSMLGVVDETGRLQYGQIFVQYTRNIRCKVPPENSARQVLTGPILLTKNPCIVAGDVRVLQAVDIPELRHLCDVVVFPQHGPRPHPDEMAGSDLDGDEYSVIWDEDLLLERNESPFDFTTDKRAEEDITFETMDEKMREFFIKYIMQDSVGTISNAFLFQSDLYGIDSEVCQSLAKKNSQAVDFTKTGQPPEPLRREWIVDEATGKEIPPEKSERCPDFHFANDYNPIYVSPRLIGKLYREIKAIEDVLKISEERDEQVDIVFDAQMDFPGWEEKYRLIAVEQLSKYNTLLRAQMENYGIQSEGEIFSGCISEMRNRISDRDQDDMSFYNTNQMIETKITGIFRRFREDFFEEFGGWRENTVKDERSYSDEENVFHRVVRHPSDDMRRKAVAYYRVCYEMAARTREKKLSFAWIAYDVLADVKQKAVNSDPNYIPGINPLYEMLDAHNTQYCEANRQKFLDFAEFREGEAIYSLKKYTRMYKGLDRVLFIVSEWADKSDLFCRRLQSHHLSLLVILFAINYFSSLNGNAKRFIDEIDDDVTLPSIEDKTMVLLFPSQLIVSFFEFLASRSFRKLDHLSFNHLGYNSVFLRGEWIPIHTAAVKTYYNLVFNLRFEELPLPGECPELSRNVTIRENEPFVIELPDNINDEVIRERLIKRTRVEDVQLRRLPGRQRGRVTISARGTLESLRILRHLVAVKPPIRSAARGKEISEQLSRLVYENIMRDD